MSLPSSKTFSPNTEASNYISRDISWLRFNERVLAQARRSSYSFSQQLRFLSIASRNSDEFFMIRVGSLYNYIDYDKPRIDYSGLSLMDFKSYLLQSYKKFAHEQHAYFAEHMLTKLSAYDLRICVCDSLSKDLQNDCKDYFRRIIYPMLTPMVYDGFHSFPVLMNHVLIFAVVSQEIGKKSPQKVSFLQIPKNIPRFYEIQEKKLQTFVPIESIIKAHIQDFFKNVELRSISLIRLTRNGDFSLDESEDIEDNFLEELKVKLRDRRTGRVVRIEVEADYDQALLSSLCSRWQVDTDNLVEILPPAFLDLRSLHQIIHSDRLAKYKTVYKPVAPLSLSSHEGKPLLEVLKKQDILLHHPYHSINLLTEFIEQAADDPHVLSIKLTLYRVAKQSRIIEALLRASEAGKHVAVLFEVKARFDEERNMREALRLQKAGCYVVYGLGVLKTHAKLMLIVRKDKSGVCRYVHTATGNYNEETAKEYSDLGLLSTNSFYADDISEFFNAITGHSHPRRYKYLITSPKEMREALLDLVAAEIRHAKHGKASGIVLKINSLQDKDLIDALYEASQAGVPVKLIVRGVCCLRPARKGLSENIYVCSLVGRYLEHARIFYFHNKQKPKIYMGSPDVMLRSFDTRIESLVQIIDQQIQKEVKYILYANLRDNQNTYIMQEDGSYLQRQINDHEEPYNIHEAFYTRAPGVLKEPMDLFSVSPQAVRSSARA